MNGRYILDAEGNPQECEDVFEWGRWMETGDRIVGRDILEVNGVEVRVSTVFLGLDHNFYDSGEPILFETMIFGGEHDCDQWRYCTRSEALEGHKKAIEVAKGNINE